MFDFPSESSKRATRLASVATSWALFLVLFIAVLAVWDRYGESYIGYYAPTLVVWQGGNPYDYLQALQVVEATIGMGGNTPFYYPIWLTFLVGPLIALPFNWSKLAWLVLSVVFWVSAMPLFESLFRYRLVVWVRWLVWLWAFWVFGWLTLRAEQIAFAILLALAVCLWAITRRRTIIAAASLALLLLKPNISFLPFAAILLYLWDQDRQVVWRTLGILAGLVVVSTLIVPQWWEPIGSGRLPRGWDQGLNGLEVEGRRLNTTTLDWLDYTWGIQGLPAVLILASIAVFAAFWLLRWRRNLILAAILAIPLGFLLTPYAMQYDYALLIPTFLFVLQKSRQVDYLRRGLVWMGLVCLSGILIVEGPISDGLWLPIILLILLFIVTHPYDSRIPGE